ncbi:helix-turn-helix domain-containing protein [Comamonas sp. JUb58]|uniref:winged helix-turn-helix transcriptional regulator n=1 Tax=Comamonas sp. JUb58 TaxID=2485114 RepID=UPI00105FBF82|nr:helix-turn-helix domain-containing protein [Comamonas sp. JUb58]TDS72822.1 HxlR family transcriptional regulator [Comamonas sp. JUb58]
MTSPEPCPVARALDAIGDRWSLLIVRDAFDGVQRFGDLQRNLGMARNILSDRLRKLVDAGVLQTQPASDGSAYQEYALTAKGLGLFPVVVALRQWGEDQLFAPGEVHSSLVEKASGQPVARMQPKTADGQVLAPDAAMVRKLG